jgi:hypothetical protein
MYWSIGSLNNANISDTKVFHCTINKALHLLILPVTSSEETLNYRSLVVMLIVMGISFLKFYFFLLWVKSQFFFQVKAHSIVFKTNVFKIPRFHRK